jgi:alkaline phosphatase D
LGVASGDPLQNGVVLWTRLAPDPLNGGGMPGRPIPVRWQVAEDERFRRVVRRGTARAAPHYAYSVHVEVGGLRPGREYWYRFAAGDEFSPPARTRTAPAAGARELSFAVASCQHYEHGWYVAYRDLARQDLDFVLQLGDYIYEDALVTCPALGSQKGAGLDDRRPVTHLGQSRSPRRARPVDATRVVRVSPTTAATV